MNVRRRVWKASAVCSGLGDRGGLPLSDRGRRLRHAAGGVCARNRGQRYQEKPEDLPMECICHRDLAYTTAAGDMLQPRHSPAMEIKMEEQILSMIPALVRFSTQRLCAAILMIAAGVSFCSTA